MRKLIAMALLGAGAVFYSAHAPAQAMTAATGGVAKAASTAESQVVEVGRRHWRHRHHRHWRHRHWRHRHHHHHRRWYRPYYYGGYGYPYYYYPRRRGFGVHLYF